MRNIKIAGLCALMLALPLSTSLFAQKDKSGISPELIQKMQKATDFEGPWRAIYNALLNSDIKSIALYHDKMIQDNDLFNVTIEAKGVTDQKSSGRCWLFASLNLLRPAIIKKYKLNEFEFSQNYLTFWDKLEKTNNFLEFMIEMKDRDLLDRELQIMLKEPIDDGGWWFNTVDLIEKYGCVPKEAMPETQSSSNTGMMNNLIGRKLRQCAAVLREMAAKGSSLEKLREAKRQMLVDVYRMLALNLGIPPQEFVWRYESRDTVVSAPKKYTPLQFYKEVVGVDLKEYVTVSDHPGVAKFKMYRLGLTRNLHDKEDGTMMNLPIDSLKNYVRRMLLDSQAVVFACDVGKDDANHQGIFQAGIYDYESVYGVDLKMNKAQRLTLFESTNNHMMLFTGCDTSAGAVAKWKVENSWGDDRGNKGYWTMYDDWFTENVYEIIVHKKYLSKELLKILGTEPIELPNWDPYTQCESQ